MAVARSGTATTSSSATARGAITVTLDKTYNVGDTLVVLFAARSATATVTVTSTGSTWTSIAAGTGTNDATQLAYCAALGSSTSQVTITPNASVIWMGVIIGFTGVTSITQATSLSSVATNPAASPAMTPAIVGCGLVGGVSCGVNPTTFASMAAVQGGATWTQEANANDAGATSTYLVLALASVIAANTSTHQIGWTKSTASNTNSGVGLILVPPVSPSARKPVIKRQAVTTAATR